MPRKVRKKWYGLIAAVAARSFSDSGSGARVMGTSDAGKQRRVAKKI